MEAVPHIVELSYDEAEHKEYEKKYAEQLFFCFDLARSEEYHKEDDRNYAAGDVRESADR